MALTGGFGFANAIPPDVPGPLAAVLRFRDTVDDLAALDPAGQEYRMMLSENILNREMLHRVARLRHEHGPGYGLCADLFHPDRFYYELANYEVAAPFVAYLLRRFEPARPGAFGDFASRVRPGTVEGAFQDVYGVTLADAEHDFWADCEARTAAE